MSNHRLIARNTTINGLPAAEILWDNGSQADRIAVITGSAGYWDYTLTTGSRRWNPTGPLNSKSRRTVGDYIARAFGLPIEWTKR